LKQKHLEEGDDVKIIPTPPVPDIIMADWKEKKLVAVEVSSASQEYKKTKHYEGTEWDRIELIRFITKKTKKKTKRKIYISKYIRYRRTFRKVRR
jgi:hypothetical protein